MGGARMYRVLCAASEGWRPLRPLAIAIAAPLGLWRARL